MYSTNKNNHAFHIILDKNLFTKEMTLIHIHLLNMVLLTGCIRVTCGAHQACWGSVLSLALFKLERRDGLIMQGCLWICALCTADHVLYTEIKEQQLGQFKSCQEDSEIMSWLFIPFLANDLVTIFPLGYTLRHHGYYVNNKC